MTASELAERVEQRLERPVFVLDGSSLLSVDGSVQPSTSGFTVRLALSDRSGRVLGERVIESVDPDCRKLDEAVVLVIAVTLFPRRLLAAGSGMALDTGTERLLEELFQNEPAELDATELQPPRAAEPDAVPAASEVPEVMALAADSVGSIPDAARQPGQRSRQLFRVSASGVVTAGYLPTLAPGIEVAVTLAPEGFWPVRLAAAYFPEQERRATALSSGTTSFALSQASLTACPWQTGAELRLQLCTGLAFGLLRAVSTGYARGSFHQSDPMVDGYAQLDLHWRVLHHGLLQLGAGLTLPLIQHSYAYQGLDAQPLQLFRTAQLTGRIGLGLGVGF
jgi:hypothetical protein